MDKYQEALNHVSEMGLSPEQIAAVFGDQAQSIEHLDKVLKMDKAAVIASITPKPKRVVIVEDDSYRTDYGRSWMEESPVEDSKPAPKKKGRK